MPDKQRREREKIEKEKKREQKKSQAQKTLRNKRKEQRDKNMSEGRNTPVDGASEAELLSTSDNLTTPSTETNSITSGAEFCSPGRCISKKDTDKARLVIDYRSINGVLERPVSGLQKSGNIAISLP